MKDFELKALISDIDMLVVIYDFIFFKEKDKKFIDSKTYKEINESKFYTIIKYMLFPIIIIIGFLTTILLFKLSKAYNNMFVFNKFFLLIVSIIYGVLFVYSKDKIKDLFYQLKFKRAVQFAFKYYNYDQYVLFLDKYLSEVSSCSNFKNLE